MSFNGDGHDPHTLDLAELREFARKIALRRREAVIDYEDAVTAAADAEADYQKKKAVEFLRLRIEGGAGVTEAAERVKGRPEVTAALRERDFRQGLLRACLERINGIDGERASLHQIAQMSIRIDE